MLEEEVRASEHRSDDVRSEAGWQDRLGEGALIGRGRVTGGWLTGKSPQFPSRRSLEGHEKRTGKVPPKVNNSPAVLLPHTSLTLHCPCLELHHLPSLQRTYPPAAIS